MSSWQEQAAVGPWWVAFEQEVNDAERALITGDPLWRLPIYWYAGGPYKRREAAEAALAELGGSRRSKNGIAYFTSGYVVISCGQLQNLTTPPPRDNPYFTPKQTTLEKSRVQGFPDEANEFLYFKGWWYDPVQLERPSFRTPRKMRDP